MTKYVSFYAGPGAGKSTAAAGVFSALKQLGINAELVPEFAKDLAWEDRRDTLQNQVYVNARQYHMIKKLAGKADVVVTDSPVLLGSVYAPADYPAVYHEVVRWCHAQVSTHELDFYLERTNHFNPKGRIHDEAQAKNLDREIFKKLREVNPNFRVTELDIDAIVAKITNVL